jgi:nucleoside-diphosphate-sugar epimerase
MTGREFLSAVWEGAGAAPRLRIDSRLLLSAAALVSPMVREVEETLYQYKAPFVVDDSAFRRTFGDIPLTPMADAVAATLAWYRAR